MPYDYPLSGVRGDAFWAVIPLLTGTPQHPVTPAEIASLNAAWPVIQMQVRSRPQSEQVLLTLTKLAGELSIDPTYPLLAGPAPVLVIKIAPEKCQARITGYYDIEFSGPGTGPFTWIGGSFELRQDVSRASP